MKSLNDCKIIPPVDTSQFTKQYVNLGSTVHDILYLKDLLNLSISDKNWYKLQWNVKNVYFFSNDMSAPVNNPYNDSDYTAGINDLQNNYYITFKPNTPITAINNANTLNYYIEVKGNPGKLSYSYTVAFDLIVISGGKFNKNVCSSAITVNTSDCCAYTKRISLSFQPSDPKISFTVSSPLLSQSNSLFYIPFNFMNTVLTYKASVLVKVINSLILGLTTKHWVSTCLQF